MDNARKSTIGDKLKSLGVKHGAAHLAPPKVDSFSIDSVVAGEFLSTRRGDVFVAEQSFGMEYRHGEASLLPFSPLNRIAKWSKDPKLATLPISKFTFLDVETTGLSTGPGTHAFIVGLGRFVDEHYVVRQFFLTDPVEEPPFLDVIAEFLASCDALVTFNGKTFDAPLLTTRYTFHRIPVPYINYSHLDLLPLARRLWRDRLESRALKFLEEHVLGMKRSTMDVPGEEIPWRYFDFLRTGDARPLEGVFYHHAMDMVAMAALLAHMNEVIENPFEGKVQHALDFIALGKLLEDLDHWDDAARLYERGLESGLDEADFGVAVKRLTALQKRRGDFEEAVRLWKKAAKLGHIYAHVELAKYYEHRERNLKNALKWAISARREVERAELEAYVRKHWLEEIARRLARLERKDGI
jgi:uncharacterized protein YprB with RNaseH-like and TPR domain